MFFSFIFRSSVLQYVFQFYILQLDDISYSWKVAIKIFCSKLAT